MDNNTKCRDAVTTALEGLIASAMIFSDRVQDDEFDSQEAMEEFRETVRWDLYQDFNEVIRQINKMIETLNAETIYVNQGGDNDSRRTHTQV